MKQGCGLNAASHFVLSHSVMVKEIEDIKSKIERKDKRPFFTFLVFLSISTALWLLVKLSENYTTQVVFRMGIVDVPADKWVASPEQTVELTMTSDGFHTLRYRMIREQKRTVSLPLSEVPYRLESGTTYSFSSLYVTERIAELLDLNASDFTMNDAKVYFNMEPLASKVVPIVLRSDIRPQRQFGLYGIPILEPSSVTVYGPEEILDTLKSVPTQKLVKTGVSESFSETVALNLFDGRIRSNIEAVKAMVDVEKYTETDLQVPIKAPNGIRARFFPEAMTVKCLVAIKDYASLSPEDFRVEIDAGQFEDLQPLLDVRLKTWPQYVQILGTSPDKVEYLIVQ